MQTRLSQSLVVGGLGTPGLEVEWGVTSGHTQVSADPGGEGSLVLSGQGLPGATVPGQN